MPQTAGTQIGADGRRVLIASLPPDAAAQNQARIVVAKGVPSPGDVIWFDPADNTARWSDQNTVDAYIPA